LKNVILIILNLVYLSATYAGVYQCKNPTDKPDYVSFEKVELKSIEYTTKMPQISEEFTNHKIHKKNKIPFLIYFAIDSTEPFMQYSVSYEIAQLQKSCLASEEVNFAAIINSLYVEKNEIIICKNRVLRRVNLDIYYSLSESLRLKRKYLSNGDHTTRDIGPMKYWIRYRMITNVAFGNFPLAHPDFLFDLINLVMTEEDLFPKSKYMPFLNLKSHGSKQTVLSGLYECQIKAKTLNQHNFMKSVLNKDEIQQLEELNIVKNKTIDPLSFEVILSKLKLDSLVGIATSEQSNLGDTNLGDINLGNAYAGLGADDGLGTRLAFGVYHIALNTVLDDLFNKKNDNLLGFMILESCDSNREYFFQKEKNPMILGVYSAKHSLWYRNLNWWEILKQSNKSTMELSYLLYSKTQRIINIREVK
jgi:hypothetical protein